MDAPAAPLPSQSGASMITQTTPSFRTKIETTTTAASSQTGTIK